MPKKLGRYEIVRELGHGAMGMVYEALDPTIGRTVALKVVRFDVLGTTADEMARRFKNEARAAGGLSHPNIVTVYDAGEDGDDLYLTMEFIEGTTLEALLKKERRLSPTRTLEIIRQVCAGLDRAHSKGIVHRDVKPGNVMISNDGVVKITDFGIARAGEVMTMTGQVVGTPNYMSPEQVVGGQLDGRSDLFSVGVMLYEMITGERPFEGQSITTIMYKIVHETPIAPRKLDAGIHPGLSFVIEKSIEKSPDSRYQTGAELTNALENHRTADIATLTSLDAPTRAAPVFTQSPSQPPGTGASAEPVAGSTGSAAGSTNTSPAAPAPSAVVQILDRGIALWSRLSRKGKRRVIFVLIIAAIWLRCEFKSGDDSERKSQTVQTARPAVAQNSGSSDEETDTEQRAEAPPAPKTPAVVTTHKNPEQGRDYAMLKVLSDPQAAEVLVDNRATGSRTPADLRLARGKHTVTVRMPGFAPASASFTVKGGEEVEYSPHLSVAVGNIDIPNVNVPDLSKLQALSKEAQADPWREWAKAKSGTKQELAVNSGPPGATVFVDGKDTGKTTPAMIPMPPGTYHVRVELEGFHPAEKDVVVGEHRTGMAMFNLKVITE